MDKKYKIGYALSGGGAKGFAHAGAIKALEEFGIYPDIISGTSAGSIVASFYADGISPERMCELFLEREVYDFVRPSLHKGGFFKSTGFLNFLETNLSSKNIEDLKIPVRIVATDFEHGNSVVFTSGELAPRVVASSSIPIFFEPKVIDGVHYVDGGLFKNFPVSTIRNECEYVIGINVSPLKAEFKDNVIFIAERSYNYMFKANSLHDKELCDMLIEVEDALQYSTYDLKKAKEIFVLGYEKMKYHLENGDALNEIKAIRDRI